MKEVSLCTKYDNLSYLPDSNRFEFETEHHHRL